MDQKPAKTSENIVTFFAAVSPTEKLETPGETKSEVVEVLGMTEAIIIDNRPHFNKTNITNAIDVQGNHTIVKRQVHERIKRSDDDELNLDDDDDGPEGRLTVDHDDDHDDALADGLADIEDDGPYEYIQAPDDHEDIVTDPSDVGEQTEDAGEHDDDDVPHDDDDTNAVADVSDDIDHDDPGDQPFHEVLPPVQHVTVHKQAIPVRKRPKDPRFSYHVRNVPKESHSHFKVHHTDHSTVTRPKAKHSRYRQQDNYDINWGGKLKKPTYERNSQKTVTRSHPSSTQFLSPQTIHGFFAKGNPGSPEDVDHRTKVRTDDKSRTDVQYSRKAPRVKQKETSVIAFDESYKSRGITPPRWSSSYIRFEEPNSPLLSTGGEQSFDDHPPSPPIDEHPISFTNQEIAQPTNSAGELPFPSTTSPAVLSTPAYNPVWFPYRTHSLTPAMTAVRPIKTIQLPTVHHRATSLSPTYVVDLIRKYPIKIKVSESR